MKFTNKKAYDSYMDMVGLKETGRLGFAIAKNLRKFEAELQEYFAVRGKLIGELCEPTGDGRFSITQRYIDALAEYDGIVCDIPVMTVDADTFCSGGLTSQDMYVLDWMVNDEEGSDNA